MHRLHIPAFGAHHHPKIACMEACLRCQIASAYSGTASTERRTRRDTRCSVPLSCPNACHMAGHAVQGSFRLYILHHRLLLWGVRPSQNPSYSQRLRAKSRNCHLLRPIVGAY